MTYIETKKTELKENIPVPSAGTSCRAMTSDGIHRRYEHNFTDTEYMVRKPAGTSGLSFRELKIYFAEKGYHLDAHSFAANLNLRHKEGEYNLLAELLADRNPILLIFVKFRGPDNTIISGAMRH